MRDLIDLVENSYLDLPPEERELIDRYSYGDCDILALVLHDRMGWPLEASVNRNGYAHVWVIHPSGQGLDICGLQDRETMYQNWATLGSERKIVSREWLLDNMPEHQKDSFWIKKAEEAAEDYLLPSILAESAQPNLPRLGQTPFWVAPLAPLTAELKRTWSSSGPWSWVNGGCFAFAEAFHDTFGGEFWGICSEIDDEVGKEFPVEHALVKLNGAFYDFDGVVDVPAYIAKLTKWKADHNSPVPISLKARTDDYVFWFEDDFLDDDQMSLLRNVLSGNV